MSDQAEVTRRGGIDMQVCVPEDWSDDQVLEYAERENPCGTQHGWQIRKEGDPALAGAPERNPCASQPGRMHITLDA
jgi:hypothetical protein